MADGKFYTDYYGPNRRELTDDDLERMGYERVEEWRWLESTVDLQREAFGDHDIPKAGTVLADSVMMNAVALAGELHEALAEVGWKPWATPRGWLNRDAYLRELVDVGHFLANLLVAVGCTDDEWETLYRAKQRVNRERQAAGYDGVSTKCPVCHTALDDTGFRAPELICDGTVEGCKMPDLAAPFTHVVPTADAERILLDDPPPSMPTPSTS